MCRLFKNIQMQGAQKLRKEPRGHVPESPPKGSERVPGKATDEAYSATQQMDVFQQPESERIDIYASKGNPERGDPS